jgi:hypothetical protein
MLLTDEEIQERMESPLNLLNRLRTTVANVTQGNGTPVTMPPKAADLIDDLDSKVNNTRVKAHGILNATMDELRKRIPEVQKPEKLAQIAAEMSKVISHQENKNQGASLAGQIIIYAPSMQKIENYDIVDVPE